MTSNLLQQPVSVNSQYSTENNIINSMSRQGVNVGNSSGVLSPSFGGISSLNSLADRVEAAKSKSRVKNVALAYAEWLTKYDDMWQWYCHMTFRLENTKFGSVHPEKANKLHNKFLDNLNIEIFGRNYKKRSDKGVLVARSTEIGGKGGLLHYHELIGRVPSEVRRMEWKENWNSLSGYARIYQYDRNLGGAAYLSKSAYAWKRGEIDFIGPWGSVKSIMAESYQVPEIFAVETAQVIN